MNLHHQSNLNTKIDRKMWSRPSRFLKYPRDTRIIKLQHKRFSAKRSSWMFKDQESIFKYFLGVTLRLFTIFLREQIKDVCTFLRIFF